MKTYARWTSLLLLAASVSFGGAAAAPAKRQAKRPTPKPAPRQNLLGLREVKLGQAPPSRFGRALEAAVRLRGTRWTRVGPEVPPEIFHLVFEGHGWHVAELLENCVRLDGKKGPSYDAVRDLQFSPDGSRVVYVAQRRGRHRVVVDGKEESDYDKIEDGPEFSDDGRRLGYIGQRAGKWFAVVDGQEGPGYGEIEGLRFSPHGRHFVYKAREGLKSFVVLDGQRGPSYEHIDIFNDLEFSPDGSRLAYVASPSTGPNVEQVAVVDGKESPVYQAVSPSSLRFSPDGQHLAYVAKREGHGDCLLLDGREGPEYLRINDPPFFSRDGQHLMYIVNSKRHAAFVIDGRELPEDYDTAFPITSLLAWTAKRGGRTVAVILGKEIPMENLVGQPDVIESPDGRRVAFALRTDRGKSVVFTDGQPSKEYERVDSLHSIAFSPDGRRIAYVAYGRNQEMLVLDGLEGPPYDEIGHEPSGSPSRRDIVFSTDGQRVAYAARKGEKQWTAVIDGREGTWYDLVENVRFSPDGRHVAFAAWRNGKAFAILDGRPTPAYDDLMDNGPSFRDDGVLEFLGVRDRVLYRVTVPPKP